MAKKAVVCQDTPVLKPGETFDWTNSGDTDCVVTNCKPPLEKDMYRVPKHGSAPAVVDKNAKPNPPNHYAYKGDCCRIEPQPKIIIGN
jgi:hypothetical protein